MKRVPSTINRYRVILPHHPYVPPPPQAKDDPHTITPATMGRLLRGRDDPLWQVLVQNLQGISPLAAREIAFRATGDAQARCDAAEPTAIVAALRELLKGLDTHTWNPTIAREEGAIVAFAPYALTHLAPGIEALPSISQAVAAYYTQDEGRGAYAGRKQALLQRLDEVRARLERKRESLLRGLIPAEEVERLRRQGELLLGYAHAIAPGTSEVTLDAGNGERERIILDPQRSAVENAQELFRRYAKARDAAREIPPLVAAVHEAIEEIDQVVLDVTLAQRGDELIEVEREVREVVGEERVGRVRPSRLPPRLYTSREGLVILVGRNAWQNQEITFSLASPRDLWLHARGVPGSHVIVRHGGGEIPETTIEDAARLAAWYSAARQEAAVDVSVAERRYVRPIPGRLGLVRVHHERVIRVTPGEPEGAQRA
jgi:predicted ribosome quality control (RQC) complex YloA/Tae2 family protein